MTDMPVDDRLNQIIADNEPSGVDRIVVYSGGMDSFTLLHEVRSSTGEDDTIRALGFAYGQRHIRELRVAHLVCEMLGIERRVIELDFMTNLGSTSALTAHAEPVPHGHYADESMKKTVVPGRNTIMLAAGLAWAETLAAADSSRQVEVFYGAHAGDHHIYPDCRPTYIRAMGRVFSYSSEGKVDLKAPFQQMSKGEILEYGLKVLGIPLEAYASTHTCYEGSAIPCGECGACMERAEAFEHVRAADPLLDPERVVSLAADGVRRIDPEFIWDYPDDPAAAVD